MNAMHTSCSPEVARQRRPEAPLDHVQLLAQVGGDGAGAERRGEDPRAVLAAELRVVVLDHLGRRVDDHARLGPLSPHGARGALSSRVPYRWDQLAFSGALELPQLLELPELYELASSPSSLSSRSS